MPPPVPSCAIPHVLPAQAEKHRLSPEDKEQLHAALMHIAQQVNGYPFEKVGTLILEVQGFKPLFLMHIAQQVNGCPLEKVGTLIFEVHGF